MSQTLQEFFQKLVADPALQAACSDAAARGDLDGIVRLGAEAGFSFTLEDLKLAWEQQSKELSEEDLAKVAGGGHPPTPTCSTGGLKLLVQASSIKSAVVCVP